jgi:hypothetical protein
LIFQTLVKVLTNHSIGTHCEASKPQSGSRTQLILHLAESLSIRSSLLRSINGIASVLYFGFHFASSTELSRTVPWSWRSPTQNAGHDTGRVERNSQHAAVAIEIEPHSSA